MRIRVRLLGLMLLRTRSALSRWYWRSRLGTFGSGSTIYGLARIYAPRSVSIGKNVCINDFVHIWGAGGVSIGDNTLVAAHSVITSQTHDVNALRLGSLYRQTNIESEVTIGSNVWIGSGAIILPGVTIGDGSIVAAGAVVTRSVSAGTLVVGTPARPARQLSSDS